METNQINSNHEKGKTGELRVAEAITKYGFKVVHVGGATMYAQEGLRYFVFDLLPYGKGKSFWIQVKNKEPRNAYPDTGLEKWRWEKMKALTRESGMPMMLLFTDDSEKIYGDWISNLKEEVHGGEWNSKTNTEMIYFWLKDMKKLEDLL